GGACRGVARRSQRLGDLCGSSQAHARHEQIEDVLRRDADVEHPLRQACFSPRFAHGQPMTTRCTTRRPWPTVSYRCITSRGGEYTWTLAAMTGDSFTTSC